MKKRPKQKNPKSMRRRIAEWSVQIFLLIAVVAGMGAWQTRNMVESGSEAPDFSLPDLYGNQIALADASGKRVVLYFFAPWCSVCHAASHNVNALRAAVDSETVAIYAVGLSWETASELERFSKKHELTVPVLRGDEKMHSAYRVSAFPSVYILDDTHRITHRAVGYTTEWGLRLRTALASVL